MDVRSSDSVVAETTHPGRVNRMTKLAAQKHSAEGGREGGRETKNSRPY